MRYQQNAVLTSLRGAQQFLDQNSTALSAVNTSTRAQLDDVVKQITDLSVSQESGKRGSKGETARQRALRLSLRRTHMAPIAALAKFKLRDVPDFTALTMPDVNVATQSLVASAHSMADAASAHAQTFIDNGLAATFADDLRTAASAVSATVVDRTKQQSGRSGATAGLRAETKRGRALLEVLDAMILAYAGSDDQLVAEWTASTAVRRKPGPTASTTRSSGATPIHSTPPAVMVVTPTPTPAPTSTPVTQPVAVAA